MEIIKLDKEAVSDFRSLVEIFNVVFENDKPLPGNMHLAELLLRPDFIVFVVKQGGKVAGGLTIHVLHSYYSERPAAYIYDVGIAPEYQRQGLGKALIEEVCRFCEENGFDNAWVEAEGDDTGAVDFYRKTNFSTELNAIHFTYLFDK